jgi:hypothetical protein
MLYKSLQHTLSLLSSPCLHVPVAKSLLLTIRVPFTASVLNSSCPCWLVTELPFSTKFRVRVTLRLMVNRPVCHGVKSHLGPKTRFLLLSDSCRFVEVGPLSDERMGLWFRIAAVSSQHSHPQARVPRDPWPYFVSDSILPEQGGPGPRIYIPQEESGPIITTSNGFHFRRFLWLMQSESSVTLRLVVYCQSVRLDTKPFEANNQMFFFCNWTLAITVLVKRLLWRGDGFLLWIHLAFAKCTHCTYSML